MRNYCDQTTRYFKMWRQNIREAKHKEEIMRNTINHWRRNQWESARRIFKIFVSQDRQREARDNIKRTQIEQEMIQTNIKYDTEMAEIKKQEQLQAKQAMQEISMSNSTLT